MAIPESMVKAINDQIKEELKSAYIYLSIAAYFDFQNLSGFSQWMKEQFKEEIEHGMKLYDHVIQRGGKVVLEAIEKPPTSWKSPMKAIEAAHEHEKYITSKIHALVDIADKEKDYPTKSILQWFIDEQVEEEATTGSILQRLKLIGTSPSALLMLDNELKKRQSS